MDETPRPQLDRDQLASLETALEAEREAGHEQRYFVHQTLPPVPCPACGAPTAGVTMASYEDGALLIDVTPCGHRFQARVDDTREPDVWRP